MPLILDIEGNIVGIKGGSTDVRVLVNSRDNIGRVTLLFNGHITHHGTFRMYDSDSLVDNVRNAYIDAVLRERVSIIADL